MRVDPTSFEAAYAHGADPWDFTTSGYEQGRYDAIESLLRPPPAGGGPSYRRCFEPGCSVGVLTSRLARRCTEVVAVDPSPSAIATARARLGSAAAHVELDVGAVPEWWPPGRFDLVVFSELGYYFDEPELRRLVHRLDGLRDANGELVAAHWLGESADHVLHGFDVHGVLRDVLGPADAELDGGGFLAAVWR